VYNKLKYFKYYSKVLYQNWTKEKDSYSQHGEDILVKSLSEDGVKSFIDIGANDGILFSNTYKFAKQGANGICIEPAPSSFRKLKLNHLFHPRVKCLQTAVSDKSGHLYIKEDGYEQTLSRVYEKYIPKSHKVPKLCFDDILIRYPNFIEIDLLSIDVEGHEKEVLQGLKKNQFNAKIIILEIDKCNLSSISNLAALQNHTAKYTNGINTFFLNKNFNFPSIDNLPNGFSAC
jgi:FkbM family methyltransferase